MALAPGIPGSPGRYTLRGRARRVFAKIIKQLTGVTLRVHSRTIKRQS